MAPKGAHNFRDRTGEVFGRLTILQDADSGRHPKVLVRCLCGKEKFAGRGGVLSGRIQSCGCLRNDKTRERLLRHGKNGTAEHSAWCAMKKRILNPRAQGYKNYGGRGIGLCQRWLLFENFIEDMGEMPKRGMSIERIDNNGDYSKSNCMWATRSEQARNTRRTRKVVVGGIEMCLKDACKTSGRHYNTVISRLKFGYGLEHALGAEPWKLKKEEKRGNV